MHLRLGNNRPGALHWCTSDAATTTPDERSMLWWSPSNVDYPNIDFMTFYRKGIFLTWCGEKYNVDCTHPLIQTLRVCVSRDLCVCDDPTTELACPDWLNGPGLGRGLMLSLSQIKHVCLDTSCSHSLLVLYKNRVMTTPLPQTFLWQSVQESSLKNIMSVRLIGLEKLWSGSFPT